MRSPFCMIRMSVLSRAWKGTVERRTTHRTNSRVFIGGPLGFRLAEPAQDLHSHNQTDSVLCDARNEANVRHRDEPDVAEDRRWSALEFSYCRTRVMMRALQKRFVKRSLHGLSFSFFVHEIKICGHARKVDQDRDNVPGDHRSRRNQQSVRSEERREGKEG